jgi:hypothetical protein
VFPTAIRAVNGIHFGMSEIQKAAISGNPATAFVTHFLPIFL